MADKKITDLTSASTLTGTEEFAVVQGGSTKKVTASAIKTYTGTGGGGGGSDSSSSITPTLITVTTTIIDLNDSQYDDAVLILYSTTETSGNTTHRLPDATAHANRVITFVAGSGFPLVPSFQLAIKPRTGQTLDNQSSTDTGIIIQKSFEVAKVWSDGSNWITLSRNTKTSYN
jgi:hypothetical protein